MRWQRLTQITITGLLVSLGSLWSTHQALAMPAPDQMQEATKAPAPSSHTARIHSPAPHAALMDNSPRFTGEASASVRAMTILLHDERQMLVQSLSVEPDEFGYWEIDAAIMGDGRYVATIKDAEHDHTLATLKLSIDTFIPAAFIQSPAPGERVDGAKAIEGHVDEPDASLTVTLRDELGHIKDRQQPVINPDDGTWHIWPQLNAQGTYIIETTTQDRAGNKVTLARHFVQRQAPAPQQPTPTLHKAQDASDALIAHHPLDHHDAPLDSPQQLWTSQRRSASNRSSAPTPHDSPRTQDVTTSAQHIARVEHEASDLRALELGGAWAAPRAGPLINALRTRSINSAPSRAG